MTTLLDAPPGAAMTSSPPTTCGRRWRPSGSLHLVRIRRSLTTEQKAQAADTFAADSQYLAPARN